ncbi:TerB family tellurite resistance protein [Brevibacillus fluminis]|uniref:TerB family tellurite resistance protein n=2 Tax=Brevibacillus fluminis TaxID=511487 RepID=A0A3M8DJJ5_9BACL|nr:TerB family tellurite resistance protein [Brevibacillus fluminis]
MICVGHADGYMGMKEMTSISQMVNNEHFNLRERQVLMDDLDHPKSPEEIVEEMLPLDLTSKLTVIRQLYHIALIDRKLSVAEQCEIRRIAVLLGIPADKQEQVESWIADGIVWRERWQQIVGE